MTEDGCEIHDMIGIVTVLYNSRDVVDGFFASLALQHGIAFKVYIIDNSADSITLEYCRQLANSYGIDAEFVYNGANLGVAAGNNQGIVRALRDRCQYILLSNNDIEFGPGTLETLLREIHVGEAVVTPKILYPGSERLIWFAGGRVNSWVMRTPHLGMLKKDRGQYDQVKYADYAPTCFLLLKATLVREIGLMDEKYFVYYDDTDFVWRLRQYGVRIRVVPSVEVVHKVSTSTGGARSPFTVYYSNRNRIYFVRKHFKGLRRTVALAYILITRIPWFLFLPRPVASRLWAGVRDGLRLTESVNGR